MRTIVSLLLLIAATAAAQNPGVAATTAMPSSAVPAAAADRDSDAALLPDDPEVVDWHTREGRSNLRFTRAVHAGSSGLLRSYELGGTGQREVPAAVVAWTDRREYDLGDTATVYVRNVGTVPGYVAVFRVDAQGEAHVLFPLAPADDNYVSQEQTIAVRALPSGGTFAVDSVDGTSLLYAVISRDPLDFYAYNKSGKWTTGDALRVQAPPSDALTDHWGKLYWELSGLAQRMTESYSAHLVTYAVAARNAGGLTPAMARVQLAALRSSVPTAYYVGTYGVGSYLGRPASYAHAAEADGGLLDHCFDANGNPTYNGPWCAWQLSWYGSATTCLSLEFGAIPCQSPYVGLGSTVGTRSQPPTTPPTTTTPPRSTDLVGKRGAPATQGKGSPVEPPAYITSAFKPRSSAPAPAGVPGGGSVAGGAPNHGGPPEAAGGGHFAPPEIGGFTPPTSVGGGPLRGGSGAAGSTGGGNGGARSVPAQSAAGSAPKRVDPPARSTPAPAPPPPPPAHKPPAA